MRLKEKTRKNCTVEVAKRHQLYAISQETNNRAILKTEKHQTDALW